MCLPSNVQKMCACQGILYWFLYSILTLNYLDRSQLQGILMMNVGRLSLKINQSKTPLMYVECQTQYAGIFEVAKLLKFLAPVVCHPPKLLHLDCVYWSLEISNSALRIKHCTKSMVTWLVFQNDIYAKNLSKFEALLRQNG